MEEVWVQVKGIPPKWADWWTIKDVASSLGLLSEVDWTTLFSTFFSTAKIKIKCKDPIRIPEERVYEMGGSCYLVTFTAEGVEQIDDLNEDNDGKGDDGKGDDGKGDDRKGNEDDGKGDDDDPEEDDLLGDDSDEDLNQDKGKTQEDGSSKQNGQSGSKKMDQTNTASSSKSQKGSKTVKTARRPLAFLEDFHELSLENTNGVNLLKAVKLEGSDGEDTDSLGGQLDDKVTNEESSVLPIEWVDNLSAARKSPNKETFPSALTTYDSANPEANSMEEEGDQYSQPTNEDIEKFSV